MDELTAVQEQRPAAVSADNNAQENSGEQMLRDMDEVAEEIERTFSYDWYQVCRKEMFAHLRDPAVTIRKDSITFNTSCIEGMEDIVYVQVMINPEEQRMVVRKCDENDKDSLRWCISKPDKRKSRKITSKPFSKKIYEMMGWNEKCRYKILGYRISYEGEQIYVFKLSEPEIFMERRKKGDPVREQMTEEEVKADIAASRKPFYPENWKDSFGLPVEEHAEDLKIDTVDGYSPMDNFSGSTAAPKDPETQDQSEQTEDVT